MSKYYFAWVNETDTTFDPHMYRTDETILKFDLKHEEGEIPTLTLTIKNPRVGLLSPHRLVWAWFARDDGNNHVVPLFFGVLVGIPSNLFKETIDIKLIARSPNYIANKQAVAETMKVRPYYDPVFLEIAKRDDPDTILEGWSSLWHIDRISLVVTASDILTGEDGTVIFTGDGDALYESVILTVGEAPLTNIQVRATVNWTQRSSGYIVGPNVNIASYTGDTFMGEWPKPGVGLGGGWKVESSYVYDVYMVSQTPTAHASSSWSDSTITEDCTTNATSSAVSGPALLSPNPIVFGLTSQGIGGECDPDSTPPKNKPQSASWTGEVIPQWFLNCTWNLRYDAKREYSEQIMFDIQANTQSIITSPTVQQDTELIVINGSNVGEPLIDLEAWSDFAGQEVYIGQIIFPNNPTTPGGLSYQVCISSGIAGTVEPVFSDVPGVVIDDGSVQWASMGTQPLTSQPNWSDSTFVGLGEIIFYVPKTFNLASGDWETSLTGTYLLCVGAGETNSTYSEFTYTPTVTTSDEPTPAPVVVAFIPGPSIGSVYWSYPGSSGGYGGSDGSVSWLDLGSNPAFLGIPIGGSPLDVTASNYFPSNLQSVEYLIMKARARLRLRSRAVKITWDCPIENAMGLSCRMNATLNDSRLPGGAATGKIISYSMTGEKGKERGHVEIGVCVGLGGSVSGATGTPEYAVSGYMNLGYQIFDGLSIVPTMQNDIAYSPPNYESFDDGLVFPLAELPGLESGKINGNVVTQAAAIAVAIPTTQQLAQLEFQMSLTITTDDGDGQTTTSSGGSEAQFWYLEQKQFLLTAKQVPYVMEENPVSYEIFIQPVTNGPFNGSYDLIVTPLELPMGINLLAD